MAHEAPSEAALLFSLMIYFPFASVSLMSPLWGLSWRRKWQPTPVFLPGRSHGRRSLVGYSPWGCEESDTSERLHFDFSLSYIRKGNDNPLQYSCLENRRDRGAWWAAVCGVVQSQTRLMLLTAAAGWGLSKGFTWLREASSSSILSLPLTLFQSFNWGHILAYSGDQFKNKTPRWKNSHIKITLLVYIKIVCMCVCVCVCVCVFVFWESKAKGELMILDHVDFSMMGTFIEILDSACLLKLGVILIVYLFGWLVRNKALHCACIRNNQWHYCSQNQQMLGK